MSGQAKLVARDGWKRVMDPSTASSYLDDEYSIPLKPKALANRRASRQPPHAIYFGSKPMYRIEELDRFAAEDAFSPQSPHTKVAERRRAAGLPPPAGVGRPRKTDHQEKAKPKLKAEARP